MNEQDRKWIDICRADKESRYVIMFDNDEVFVWDFEMDEEAYVFTSYGYHLAKDLAEYIGCECDYV
jgi:hypothetical protein